MPRPLTAPVLLLALLAAVAAPALAAPALALQLEVSEPLPVPSVEIQDMAGQDFDLAAAVATGEVVVLNFWATWCAPCKREMPTLAALQDAFEGRPLVVRTLAMDRAGPEALRAFMADVDVNDLTIWRDPKMATAQPLAIPGLPVTIVIDGQGNEIFRHAGYADWAAPEIVAFLGGLLGDTP